MAQQQHVGGEPDPADETPGAQDRHVENAVIGHRVRQQPEVGLKRADIADDHAAGPAPQQGPAVGPEAEPGRPVPQMPHPREPVGNGARTPFQLFAGAREQLGVEPDSGHHHERLPVGEADVHLALGAGQRDGQRAVEVKRQPEVVREQVPRATGQHAKRNPGAGDAAGARGDGPVTPAGDHQVNPGKHRLLGQFLAGFVGGRLHPERLGPALAFHGLPDGGMETVQVVILARVHDDRRTPHVADGGFRVELRHVPSPSPWPLVLLRPSARAKTHGDAIRSAGAAACRGGLPRR